jgi:uncharacterized membrane protein YeaQ/YmgE (transglycosylase-associated protein family)
VDTIQLLILLVVVGICGAIAQWIVGFNPGGLLLTIIVGVIGAYLGTWLGSLLPFQLPLFSLFTIEVGTTSFNLLWAVIGSILLLLLLNFLRSGMGRQQLRRP